MSRGDEVDIASFPGYNLHSDDKAVKLFLLFPKKPFLVLTTSKLTLNLKLSFIKLTSTRGCPISYSFDLRQKKREVIQRKERFFHAMHNGRASYGFLQLNISYFKTKDSSNDFHTQKSK